MLDHVSASLAVALLAGLGGSLLAYGLIRTGARKARSRRLVQIVGLVQPAVGPRVRRVDWLPLELLARQFVGVLRGYSALVSRLATVLGLAAAVTGLISGEVIWFGLLPVACGAVFWVHRQSATRRRLERQAPAALEMVSAALRAGYSVPQAMARVARELPAPTAAEFGRIERELALGSSLSDSLTKLAERTTLSEYTLVSIMIWIHAQVGGNLSVVLDSVVDTLRERFDQREHVLALTAQQRLASLVLTLLPVGIFVLMLMVDRPTVEPMFTLPAGRVMLGVAAVLISMGWLAMRGLGRVEF